MSVEGPQGEKQRAGEAASSSSTCILWPLQSCDQQMMSLAGFHFRKPSVGGVSGTGERKQESLVAELHAEVQAGEAVSLQWA